MKINGDDFSEDGFTVEDSAQVCHALASLGIGMIEVSGGGIGREDKWWTNLHYVWGELRTMNLGRL